MKFKVAASEEARRHKSIQSTDDMGAGLLDQLGMIEDGLIPDLIRNWSMLADEGYQDELADFVQMAIRIQELLAHI